LELLCYTLRLSTKELQQQIDNDSARWIKHSLRGASQERSPSSSPSPNSKSFAGIPLKIQTSYAEIETLSNEKMILAEKIISLVTRTRNRLDSDLNKVRVLQGETPTESISAKGSASSLNGTSLLGNGHDAAASLSESLRLALAPSSPSPAEIRKGTAAAAPTKRRGRSAASPSIKLPAAGSRSISPAAAAPPKALARSSRLSRQIHPPVDDDVDMVDEDAEGEDDIEEPEEGDDADDDKLYCFCQTSSYGDMIACDNEGSCPYEWFHLSCVGLSKPLPDKWYCSVCSVKMTVTATVNVGRKGRKK
jgi:chromatin modification-related protein YNG2